MAQENKLYSDLTLPETCVYNLEDSLTSRSSLDAVRRALEAAECLTNMSSSTVLSSARLHSYKNKGETLSASWENGFDVNMAKSCSASCEEDSFAFNLQVILAAIVSVAEAERIDLEKEVRCRIRSLEFEKPGDDDMSPSSLSLPVSFTQDERVAASTSRCPLHHTTSSAQHSCDEAFGLLPGCLGTAAKETECTPVITATETQECQELLPRSTGPVWMDEVPKPTRNVESVPAIVQHDIHEDDGNVGDDEGGENMDLINENKLCELRHPLPPLHVATTQEENVLFLDPPASIEGISSPHTLLDASKDASVGDTGDHSYHKTKNSSEKVSLKEGNASSTQETLSIEKTPVTLKSTLQGTQNFTEMVLTDTLEEQQSFAVGKEPDTHAILKCDGNENSDDVEACCPVLGAISGDFSPIEVSRREESGLSHEHLLSPNPHSNTLTDKEVEALVAENICSASGELDRISHRESLVSAPVSNVTNTGESFPLPGEITVTAGASADECKVLVSSQTTGTVSSSIIEGNGEAVVSLNDGGLLRISDPLGILSTCPLSMGEECNALLRSFPSVSSSEVTLSFPGLKKENGQSYFTQMEKGKIETISSLFPHKSHQESEHSIPEVIDESKHSLDEQKPTEKDVPLTDLSEPAGVMECAPLSAKPTNVPSLFFSSSIAQQNTPGRDLYNNNLFPEKGTCPAVCREVQAKTLSPIEGCFSSANSKKDEVTEVNSGEADKKDKYCDDERTVVGSTPNLFILPCTFEECIPGEKLEVSDMTSPYINTLEAQLLPYIDGNDDTALITGECSPTTLTITQIQQLPIQTIGDSVSLSANSQQAQDSSALRFVSDLHAGGLRSEACIADSPNKAHVCAVGGALTERNMDAIPKMNGEEPVVGDCASAFLSNEDAAGALDRPERNEATSEAGDTEMCPPSSLRESTIGLSSKSDSESCDSRMGHSKRMYKPLYGLLLFEQVIRDLERGSL